jgi:hypothetical protein
MTETRALGGQQSQVLVVCSAWLGSCHDVALCEAFRELAVICGCIQLLYGFLWQ